MGLLLFDIDGTMIRPMGLGRKAFESALQITYGRLPEGEPFPYDGLLDPMIARRTLEAMGLGATESEIRLILAAYVDCLRKQPPQDPDALLCPGFPSLLEDTKARGHSIALLTGNVREGAEAKLTWAGLAGHFRPRGPSSELLGAFGEDAVERSGLVPIAMERCRRTLGIAFTAEETWIVGDSAKDVQAAHAAGVRCAAVATGITGLEALQSLGPELALPDLSEPAPLWQAVEAGGGR
jgi:phosphoglycolate phosphatase